MATALEQTLVITDLDGTLLPASKQLDPSDIEAVLQFMALGGKFTIATGRTLEATQCYLEQLQPNVPAILYNGAMLYDCAAKRPIETHPLPTGIIDTLRALMAWNPDMGVEILTADAIYVVRNNDYETRHIALCGVQPVYAALEDIPADGWLKILFAMSPTEVDRLAAYTDTRQDTGVTYVRSADIFLEILPEGASKGEALLHYRNRLIGSGGRVIAAGDYHNDLTMLQAADLGVAPANAQRVVKDAAALVLPQTCEEHAIAALLQAILAQKI